MKYNFTLFPTHVKVDFNKNGIVKTSFLNYEMFLNAFRLTESQESPILPYGVNYWKKTSTKEIFVISKFIGEYQFKDYVLHYPYFNFIYTYEIGSSSIFKGAYLYVSFNKLTTTTNLYTPTINNIYQDSSLICLGSASRNIYGREPYLDLDIIQDAFFCADHNNDIGGIVNKIDDKKVFSSEKAWINSSLITKRSATNPLTLNNIISNLLDR